MSDDELDLVNQLARAHDAELPEIRRFDNEYNLLAARHYIHPEILRELGDRMEQVVYALPQLVVDSVEELLDVEGFRLSSDDSSDDDLWRVWQANDLDEMSQLGHIDALTCKRAYIAVGTNEDDADTPLVTFESALEVYADISPRTRKVTAALRRWQTGDPYAMTLQRNATLYLPNKTVFYATDGTGGGYKVVDQDDHNLGEVPIVPMVNRGRLTDYRGRSELATVLPLCHAMNKVATDMLVATEFVALPLRGFLGVGPDAFEDESGNKLTTHQALLARALAIPDDGEGGNQIKTFEFAAAQLTNFTAVLNQIAQGVSAISGLPPHYLGLTTDNPASAEAIQAAKDRLIKRARRKQRAFGGGHERGMRLVRRFQEGDWDPALKRLETIWRDAADPTLAQQADAVLKLYNLPEPLLPRKQAREALGKTPTQIADMEEQDALAAAQQAAAFSVPTAAEQQGAPSDGTDPNAAPVDKPAAA